jgi:hypothetical protein
VRIYSSSSQRKAGIHLYAAPDFPQMRCSANNVARSCDCNMASAGVTSRCATGKNSRPQPRTRRLCLGPGDMIFMQIFIYRFTDASHGKIG